MNKKELHKLIIKKRSFLSVGLDTDIQLIPQHLLKYPDPVFEFNKAIIDATIDIAVAYKPNLAFYESAGLKGWASLEKTIKYLNQFKGDVFTIADAKRGDIGNTSKMYAKAFFETMDFDAVTVAPYMGADSVKPFLEYKDKWVIVLGLNSNESSKDFQLLQTENGKLYEQVIRTAQKWASPDNLMLVIGATHPEEFKHIRELAPDYFYLVPGVGAQGGEVSKICENGLTSECGLIINSARGIIYAGKDDDFANAARKSALKTVEEMRNYLSVFSKG